MHGTHHKGERQMTHKEGKSVFPELFKVIYACPDISVNKGPYRQAWWWPDFNILAPHVRTREQALQNYPMTSAWQILYMNTIYTHIYILQKDRRISIINLKKNKIK